MKMRNGLAASLTDVDAHVEAVRAMGALDLGACDRDSTDQLRLLLARRVEPATNVPLGHKEGMAGADRESIPQANRERTCVEDPISGRGAEGTARHAYVRTWLKGSALLVMISPPSRPTRRQEAQRHSRTGLPATRLI
jgi:hypothetical protein